MNHERYQELVSRFIDCEIVLEEERELFAHLGNCDDCRQFLKECVQVHGDLTASKIKSLSSVGASMTRKEIPDRPPAVMGQRRSTYSRLRTFALVTLIAILAGMFWSTTLSKEPEKTISIQPRISADEMQSH